MGIPYKTTLVYKKILAISDYLNNNNLKNTLKAKRLSIDLDALVYLDSIWGKKVNFKDGLDTILKLISLDKNSNSQDILCLEEEYYLFCKLSSFLENYPLKKQIELFLKKISNRRIDDTSGGKITLMGILETRGISFDGVIIVDFNDDVVFPKNKKDMFISTNVKKRATLPTIKDRQNLQKHYYNQLIKNSKRCAISYIEDDKTKVSRLLYEFNLKQVGIEEKRNNQYSQLLFKLSNQNTYFEKDINQKINFEKIELSYSKFKTLLECKRKFYLQYIKKIKDDESILSKDIDSREIGLLLHKVLKAIYINRDMFKSKEDFKKSIKFEIYKNFTKNTIGKFMADYWFKKLSLLAENEIKKFKDGFRVKYLEVELEKPYKKFILKGIIDRIDQRENNLYIIDYKKNLYTKNSTQLAFYKILASDLGNIDGFYFYNLMEAKEVAIQKKEIQKEKENIFKNLEIIAKDTISFEKTTKVYLCIRCPYKFICNRASK